MAFDAPYGTDAMAVAEWIAGAHVGLPSVSSVNFLLRTKDSLTVLLVIHELWRSLSRATHHSEVFATA